MKRIYALICVLLYSFSVVAQRLDPSFSVAITRPPIINALAQQPDGKLLVGGFFSLVDQLPQSGLARLLENGQIDLSFRPYVGDTVITSIAVQPDGKVIAAGYTRGNEPGQEFGIISRYLPNGQIDPDFKPSRFNDRVQTLLASIDGTILVGGIFSAYGPTPTDGLARLTESGLLKQRFSLKKGNSPVFIYALLFAENQSYYAGGNTGSQALLMRFDAEDNPDPTLQLNTRLSNSDSMTSIQYLDLTAEGQLVFTTLTWEFRPLVIRINKLGEILDKRHIPTPFGLAITRKDEILISGNNEGKPDIYRVLPDTLVPYVNGQWADDQVYKLLRLNDGHLLASGRFSKIKNVLSEGLIRMNQNGQLLSGFKPNLQRPGLVRDIHLLPDGKTLVAGYFTKINGEPAVHLARLLADGKLDPGFGQTSIPVEESINAIAVQADGKIWVGSSFSILDPEPFFPLILLQKDGRPDPGFRPDKDAQIIGNIQGIELLENGDGVAYGSFTLREGGQFYRNLVRFSAKGKHQPVLSKAISGGKINAVKATATEQLLVGGNGIRVGEAAPSALVRINYQGLADPDFQPSLETESEVYRIAATQNQDFMVSGNLKQRNRYYELLRLKSDGRLDASFSWPALGGSGLEEDPPRSWISMSSGNLLISNSAVFPNRQLLLSDPEGEILDSFQFQPPLLIEKLELQDDSTAYLAGSFQFLPHQVSLIRVKLFEQQIITDISDISKLSGLSVFPIPTDDQLHLHFRGEIPRRGIELTLYTPKGRPLAYYQLTSSQKTISIGHLPAGPYLLHIRNQSKRYNRWIFKF